MPYSIKYIEYIIKQVIEDNSVKWKLFHINAFHRFSSFRPFLRFLILPSTNSYSYNFLLSVWYFLLAIENIKHTNFSCFSHWTDPWSIAAIQTTKTQTPKQNQTHTHDSLLYSVVKFTLLYNSSVIFKENKRNDISTHYCEIKCKVKLFSLTWSSIITFIIRELWRITLNTCAWAKFLFCLLK